MREPAEHAWYLREGEAAAGWRHRVRRRARAGRTGRVRRRSEGAAQPDPMGGAVRPCDGRVPRRRDAGAGVLRGSAPEIVEHGVTGYLCTDEADMVSRIGQIDRLDRADCRATVTVAFLHGPRCRRSYRALCAGDQPRTSTGNLSDGGGSRTNTTPCGSPVTSTSPVAALWIVTRLPPSKQTARRSVGRSAGPARPDIAEVDPRLESQQRAKRGQRRCGRPRLRRTRGGVRNRHRQLRTGQTGV